MREITITKQIPENIEECESILCKNCNYRPINQGRDHCCEVRFRWWKMRKQSRVQLENLIKLMGFDKELE